MTPFKPSLHGFPFPNWWPPGTPVIEVPTPFGKISIGDAHGGVCGGMVFAAADYYLAGRPVPDEPTDELFNYFCRRLLVSWQIPFGIVRYYDWQRRPTASRRGRIGTAELTKRELSRLPALLSSRGLAPLGVVMSASFNPKQLVKNHQVLAYDLENKTSERVVSVYDPNYPNDDAVQLIIPNECGEKTHFIRHSCEGVTIRGLFAPRYAPAVPPGPFTAKPSR